MSYGQSTGKPSLNAIYSSSAVSRQWYQTDLSGPGRAGPGRPGRLMALYIRGSILDLTAIFRSCRVRQSFPTCSTLLGVQDNSSIPTYRYTSSRVYIVLCGLLHGRSYIRSKDDKRVMRARAEPARIRLNILSDNDSQPIQRERTSASLGTRMYEERGPTWVVRRGIMLLPSNERYVSRTDARRWWSRRADDRPSPGPSTAGVNSLFLPFD